MNTDRYSTPSSRRKLCQEWCTHLANGLPKETFEECDPQTLRKYVAKYPEDFDLEEIGRAERKGYNYWYKMGIAGSMGQLKGFNPASWIFNMKNRFGWRDRVETRVNDDFAVSTFIIEPDGTENKVE